MIERIAIVVGLGLGLLALAALGRLWRRAHVRRLGGQVSRSPLPRGRPGIVAFSTPTCAECRMRQAPALARLTDSLGETISMQSLSALEHSELVTEWGILTVPATVVVDASGAVRHLNLGYASDHLLRAQLDPLLA